MPFGPPGNQEKKGARKGASVCPEAGQEDPPPTTAFLSSGGPWRHPGGHPEGPRDAPRHSMMRVARKKRTFRDDFRLRAWKTW